MAAQASGAASGVLAFGLSTAEFPAAGSAVLLGDLLDMASDIDADFVATRNTTQLPAIGSLPANVSALGAPESAGSRPGRRRRSLAYATYIHESGAGLMFGREEISVETLHKQITRLLHERAFRHGTERLHTDLLATPAPTEVVPVLERLTADHSH